MHSREFRIPSTTQQGSSWATVAGKEELAAFEVDEVDMIPQLTRSLPETQSRSFVHRFPSLAESFSETLPLRVVVVASVSMAISMIFGAIALSGDEKCLAVGEQKVPTWKPVFVLNLIVLFCVFVIEGFNAECSMFGLSTVAVVVGCLSPDKLYAGASSSAVVSLALLFPVAKAMADTGAPEAFVGHLMGSPKTLGPAIARMFLAVSLLSGFFNNTPIVAMMIPVLQGWCKRLGFDARAMLMPLSFASQAGGCLSIMGSSINFVARQVFVEATNDKLGFEFELQFFDLTLGGVALMFVDMIYCALLAPRILTRGVQDDGLSSQPASATPSANYVVLLVVAPGSVLVGSSVEETGIHRLAGVSFCTALYYSLANGTLRVTAKGWENVRGKFLDAGHVLAVPTTAEGVVELRHIKGCELANEQTELMVLGAHRRSRALVEATVGNDLVGTMLSVGEMKHQFRCAVVAVRSAQGDSPHQLSCNGYEVKQGDVLLLEAFKCDVGSPAWNKLFAMVLVVPKSAPPRSGRAPDTIRAIFTGVGMVTIISLTAVNNPIFSLPVTLPLLLCALFVGKALCIDEAYAAVNSTVLLTIVGALAIGGTMEETRLAHCFADGVVSLTRPFGTHSILAGIYLAIFSLGFFVTNAAVVAIMGQIGAAIVIDNPELGLSMPAVALLVVYASSACWCTPYGYQTNLMVMKECGYSWGDFIRFGLPLQLLHLVVAVLLAEPCGKLLGG